MTRALWLNLISEDHGTGIGPSSIPEGERISGVGTDSDTNKTSEMHFPKYQPENWTAKRSGFTHVRFSRREDVETILETTRSASNSPLSNQSDSPRHRDFRDNPMAKLAFAKNRGGFPVDGPKLWEFDESSNDVTPMWGDKQFWDVWDEVLEFDDDRRKGT